MKEEKEKHDGLLVYVKNDEQKDELQRKYPTAKAEFMVMKLKGADSDSTLPMVCMTKNGKERCEIGENFIESLSKELENKEE
jgi:hypothetical protein